MIGLAVVSRPIIQMLFQHGAFTHEDTVQTAHALRAYALGIPGFLLVKVFAAGFFARHDTKTPVKIAAATMVVNVLCSWLLLGPLQQVGIALSNSIAISLNAFLLYVQMRRRRIPIGNPDLAKRVMKVLLSASFMAVITIVATLFFWDYLPQDNIPEESLYLCCLILIPALSYGAALHVTKAMRWHDALAILRKKPVL